MVSSVPSPLSLLALGSWTANLKASAGRRSFSVMSLSFVARAKSPTSLVAFPAKLGGITAGVRRETERKSWITPEI